MISASLHLSIENPLAPSASFELFQWLTGCLANIFDTSLYHVQQTVALQANINHYSWFSDYSHTSKNISKVRSQPSPCLVKDGHVDLTNHSTDHPSTQWHFPSAWRRSSNLSTHFVTRQIHTHADQYHTQKHTTQHWVLHVTATTQHTWRALKNDVHSGGRCGLMQLNLEPQLKRAIDDISSTKGRQYFVDVSRKICNRHSCALARCMGSAEQQVATGHIYKRRLVAVGPESRP